MASSEAVDASTSRSTITYQQLADLEADFDDFHSEMLRIQAHREPPLYARRAALVRAIQGFWPLVFEQAPPEIDQYVQPTDAAVLLSSLENIDVTRIVVSEGVKGDAEAKEDPRSFIARFTFAPNDVFEDAVLEKRFWYRHAPKPEGKPRAEPWTGFVSEPVPIKWKKGKDLTNGLLDLAVKVWAEGDGPSENKATLERELGKTAVGGVSFFNWFGYVGRRISAEESRDAAAKEKAARMERAAKLAEKKDDGDSDKEDDKEDDLDEDDGAYEYEIFPDGDTVAVTLVEDLWPNAVRYFRQAQEQDTLSDLEFESGSEDGEDGEDAEEPPAKKQKN